MKLLVALFVFSAALCAADSPAPVTFYRDVAGILQQRCQGCHRAGEVAPMAFDTYTETRPWAKAIKQAVLSRKMPPWYAEGPAGKFHNDPSLSQPEIDKLVAWADTGAAAGNPLDAPPARHFAQGWSIQQPDQVFELPQPYEVPASGTIEYTYVIVPTGFTEDRWVTQAEVRPGNPAVVHHANVYIREPGSGWLREYPAGKMFIPDERKDRAATGGSSSAGASVREQVIVGFVPGRPPKQVPPGYAMLIPAGSDLVFQVHYTTNGKAAADRTRVGFVYAKTPPAKRVIRIQASNARFAIPPGAADYPVSGSAQLQIPCELLDAYPHMHLRGKSMALTAVYPTGEKDELVRVPHYDFNWQLIYEMKQPKILPKGTILRADATFDNSPNNRFNPDSKAEVRWGDQSWEEMMVGFFDLAIPAKADPAAVLAPQ
ncbi:MAG: thiol-disulfide isomerase [Acidobacteriia bacterium]|nr:thiol-disulfide isomerase [Terriglobia bacterium]